MSRREVQDEEVVSDGGIVTSRNPDDLDARSKASIAENRDYAENAAVQARYARLSLPELSWQTN